MTTLPKYSFISNDAIHRDKGKWSEGLVYSPTLLAFLSQKDHYVLKIKDVVYVGEMKGVGSDVPLCQALRPLPPGTNVIEFISNTIIQDTCMSTCMLNLLLFCIVHLGPGPIDILALQHQSYLL